MKTIITSRRLLWSVVLIVGVLTLGFSVRAFLDKPLPSSSLLLADEASAFATRETITASVPVRLIIPKIKVDAVIKSLGLTADGAMDIPKDPAETAWFNLGPSPGEKGSAVIAGHYGWKDNQPAVFDALSTLEAGDRFHVEDETGATITFVVREVRAYKENENASDVFSSADGKAHLNLITCEGSWNKESKSYSNRRVVFSDRE